VLKTRGLYILGPHFKNPHHKKYKKFKILGDKKVKTCPLVEPFGNPVETLVKFLDIKGIGLSGPL